LKTTLKGAEKQAPELAFCDVTCVFISFEGDGWPQTDITGGWSRYSAGSAERLRQLAFQGAPSMPRRIIGAI
jgi:hypothetical protein